MSFSGKEKILIVRSHSFIFLCRIKLRIESEGKNHLSLNKLYFVFIFTACGGELTGEGVIRSPFYPNVYPGERVCRWTIYQPQSQVVILNFTAFEIGNSAHCDTDYIEVRVK